MTKNNLVKKLLIGAGILGAVATGKVDAQTKQEVYQVPTFATLLNVKGTPVKLGGPKFYDKKYISMPTTQNDLGFELYPFSRKIVNWTTNGRELTSIESKAVYVPEKIKENRILLRSPEDSPLGINGNPGNVSESGDIVGGEFYFNQSDALKNIRCAVFPDNDTIWYPYLDAALDGEVGQGKVLNFVGVKPKKGCNFIETDADGNVYMTGDIYKFKLAYETSDTLKLDTLYNASYLADNDEIIRGIVNSKGTTGDCKEFLEVNCNSSGPVKLSSSSKKSGNSNLRARVSGDCGISVNTLGTIGPSGSLAVQFGVGKNAYLGFYGAVSGKLSGKKEDFQNPETRELINQPTNSYFVTQNSGSDELVVHTPYEAGIIFSQLISEGKGEIEIKAGTVSEELARKVLMSGREWVEINGVKDPNSVKDYSANVLHKDSKEIFNNSYKFSVGGKVYLGNSPVYLGLEGALVKTALENTKPYGSFNVKIGLTLPRSRL